MPKKSLRNLTNNKQGKEIKRKKAKGKRQIAKVNHNQRACQNKLSSFAFLGVIKSDASSENS
jgi:hypothetical protein